MCEMERNTNSPSGRVDQPLSPYPPQGGAFEMDGTGMAPVELPAFSISVELDDSTRPVNSASSTAADASANLAAGSLEQGNTQYVNQWNQYKAMAEDKMTRGEE
jgi:hypothetical protein